jgi:hypothetical protein
MFVCMTFTRNTHVLGIITPRRHVELCTRQQCTHGVVHVLTSCIVALNTCTTLIPTKYTFLQTKTTTHHHHHKNRIQSHSVPPGHTTKNQFCTPLDCMHFLSGLSKRILKQYYILSNFMFPKPTFFKTALCFISTDKGNTCSFNV